MYSGKVAMRENCGDKSIIKPLMLNCASNLVVFTFTNNFETKTIQYKMSQTGDTDRMVGMCIVVFTSTL